MSRNLLLISVVLVCLTCRAIPQDEDGTQAEEDGTQPEEYGTQITVGGVEISGVLRMAGDAYRTAVEKVQNAAEAVRNFAETSYEDHLKPVIQPSITWVTTVWDNFQTKLSSYKLASQ